MAAEWIGSLRGRLTKVFTRLCSIERRLRELERRVNWIYHIMQAKQEVDDWT